jgi:hypothetical protein
MDHFAFGIVSVAFGVLFPAMYFVGFQIRRLVAWSKRAPGPTDRIGFFFLVSAIFGFVIGSFAQPLWNKGVECRAAGQPVVSCLLLSK